MVRCNHMPIMVCVCTRMHSHSLCQGVIIMDEVDVLLHPLRSELNFPIGMKTAIDLSGYRWDLPIHVCRDGMLDIHGMLYADGMQYVDGMLDIRGCM